MRYLLLVSIFFLLLGCAPVAYKGMHISLGDASCIEKFRPSFERALYKTEVSVAGNQLSGILFIKQMPDSSVRILFSNEAGLTFFNFEFSASGDFKVHSIINKMDKKAVKKTLKNDFQLLLINRPLNMFKGYNYMGQKEGETYYAYHEGKDYYYYITDSGCTRLLRMERGNKKRKVVEAFTSELKKGVPDTIRIHHTNFNFDINLKRIYDNAE